MLPRRPFRIVYHSFRVTVLAAQTQALNQFTINNGVFVAEILQMTAALPDQLEEAAARMFVMLVCT